MTSKAYDKQIGETVTGNNIDGLELKLEVKRLDDGVVTCQGHARMMT